MSSQVAGILKLWVSSLPEPVIPPRLYDAALGTQTAHADRDAQVAALHSLLRQCEHRVLQVLFPLMEVSLPWRCRPPCLHTMTHAAPAQHFPRQHGLGAATIHVAVLMCGRVLNTRMPFLPCSSCTTTASTSRGRRASGRSWPASLRPCCCAPPAAPSWRHHMCVRATA